MHVHLHCTEVFTISVVRGTEVADTDRMGRGLKKQSLADVICERSLIEMHYLMLPLVNVTSR